MAIKYPKCRTDSFLGNVIASAVTGHLGTSQRLGKIIGHSIKMAAKAKLALLKAIKFIEIRITAASLQSEYFVVKEDSLAAPKPCKWLAK